MIIKKWKYKPIKYKDIKVSQAICWGKKVTLYSLTVNAFGFQSIISKDDIIAKVKKGLGYHQGLDIKDLERIA